MGFYTHSQAYYSKTWIDIIFNDTVFLLRILLLLLRLTGLGFFPKKTTFSFPVEKTVNIQKQNNSVVQDLPPTGSEATTPPPPPPHPHKNQKKKTLNYNIFFIPRIIFSRNIGNSIKCQKNITGNTRPPHLRSEQGNRGYIGYIFHCLYLLFGETTSHLISISPPPPGNVVIFFNNNFLFFFNVGNSIKREENMKY